MAKGNPENISGMVCKTHLVPGKNTQKRARPKENLRTFLNFKDNKLFWTQPSENQIT